MVLSRGAVAFLSLLVGSQSLSCFEDPSQPDCATFVYPDDSSTADIQQICKDFPNAAACSLFNHCADQSVTSKFFCSPFSILGDACARDSLQIGAPCDHYRQLCTPTSVVKQCVAQMPIPNLVGTKQSQDLTVSACESMPHMDGCDTCNSTYCPDPLNSLSVVCSSMGGMSECASWQTMCDTLANWKMDEGMERYCLYTSCWRNPKQSVCNDFVYPDVNQTADFNSLCRMMGFMSACSLDKMCQVQGKVDPALCKKLSLIADVCVVDGMSRMSGCAHYNVVCGPGSPVRQCADNPPFPQLPDSIETRNNTIEMCKEMEMDACSECRNTSACPDPLSTLSKLCMEMPESRRCDGWRAMCNSGRRVSGYCPVVVSCLEDPTQDSCADYTYPAANASADMSSLCYEMPNMIGCDISRKCADHKSSADYCQPMSLLADVCVGDAGMSQMKGCKPYVGLCQTPGSKVTQCKRFPKLPNVLQTSRTIDEILGMCSQMPMPACNQCTSRMSEQCKNPLTTISELCRSMDMTLCGSWKAMCSSISGYGAVFSWFCGGEGGPVIPMMRMYFHTGITDYFLFKSWAPTTTGPYVGIWLFFWALGVVSVLIKSWRHAKEQEWGAQDTSAAAVNQKDGNKAALLGQSSLVARPWATNLKRSLFVMSTVLIDYSLMLAAMSFNIGIFIAVVLGYGSGTLLFGHQLGKFRPENPGSECCD